MMATTEDLDRARAQYIAAQIDTSSPTQILLMLLERLLGDLRGAEEAFGSGQTERVHTCLVHAQQIIVALHDALASSTWERANTLRAVYRYLHKQLVATNMKKDPSLLPVCIDIVSQIKAADEKAAAKLAGEEAAGAA